MRRAAARLCVHPYVYAPETAADNTNLNANGIQRVAKIATLCNAVIIALQPIRSGTTRRWRGSTTAEPSGRAVNVEELGMEQVAAGALDHSPGVSARRRFGRVLGMVAVLAINNHRALARTAQVYASD